MTLAAVTRQGAAAAQAGRYLSRPRLAYIPSFRARLASRPGQVDDNLSKI
jgi:hypothetical protein